MDKAIVWWAGAVALAMAACASQGELAPRHTPSAHEVPSPSADFAGYVAAAEAAIAQANQAIDQPLAEQVIADRAPFELAPKGGRCQRGADGRHAEAALLIHDLGGTPYDLRDLARALRKSCYLVRAILLPGHGTVPGDLLDVDYRQWVEATWNGVASFAGEAERLVLVGFGLGATLALHHAMSAPRGSEPALGGLVLLAPALGTDPPLAWLGAPAVYRQLTAEGRWARLRPAYDPVRFESLPRNAQLQQMRLIEEVEANSTVLELPVFAAISAGDVEVNAGAVRDWICGRVSGPRRLIWYTSAPERAPECRFIEARSSAVPPDILDLSHVALPIAPDNPRYGAKAGYLDCSHYWEENSPNWLLCMDPTTDDANLRYGEVTLANRQRHLMRRLTYNPDFAAMTGAMLAFLADPD